MDRNTESGTINDYVTELHLLTVDGPTLDEQLRTEKDGGKSVDDDTKRLRQTTVGKRLSWSEGQFYK